MKFKELINSNNWLSVEMIFLSLYPEERKNIGGYEDVFDSLKMLQPKEMDVSIVVSWEKDDFDEYYVNVSGYYNHPEEHHEEPTSLALEFTPWSSWLGMDVDQNTLTTFNELEIIAHCLYEMTFIGFDEETIRLELERIEEIVDEIEHMSEEEKQEKLKSWDDIKKMWEAKGLKDFE